jgi:hypothetical protein
VLRELRERYRDSLRIVHLQFVSYQREVTMASALAACAARRQGKFAALDAALWRNANAKKLDTTESVCWTKPAGCTFALAAATEVGLDISRFKADMAGPCQQVIAKQSEVAKQFRITGIPSFFINGKYLSGLKPASQYEQLIDEELAKAKQRLASGGQAGTYYRDWVLSRGVTPAAMNFDRPDPLESSAVLARAPSNGPWVAEQVTIGWEGSSGDARAQSRSKADADALATGLREVAARGELAATAMELTEPHGADPILVLRDDSRTVKAGTDPDFNLVARLHVGEVGLARSTRGWRVLRRIAGIPAPPDVGHPPPDASKSPKGVFYRKVGSRPFAKGTRKPGPTSEVEVVYTGWTTDGRMFDSSRLHRGPARFSLDRVIAGWTDAIQLMSPGDKFRIWIPAALAYGDHPTSGRPAGMLVFDITLLSIVK